MPYTGGLMYSGNNPLSIVTGGSNATEDFLNSDFNPFKIMRGEGAAKRKDPTTLREAPTAEMERLYGELGDINSNYYQQFSKYLTNILNKTTPTTNSLLAMRTAMGFNPTSAGNIAKQQRSAIEGQNRETASNATSGLFQNMLGARTGLLGSLENTRQWNWGIEEQRRQLMNLSLHFGNNLVVDCLI